MDMDDSNTRICTIGESRKIHLGYVHLHRVLVQQPYSPGNLFLRMASASVHKPLRRYGYYSMIDL